LDRGDQRLVIVKKIGDGLQQRLQNHPCALDLTAFDLRYRTRRRATDVIVGTTTRPTATLRPRPKASILTTFSFSSRKENWLAGWEPQISQLFRALIAIAP
jgi:hypothetical protein